ncbi:MAG: hypothetical protein GQE15_10960 [Archangiaceae bacterium]|nr:hypothetical protein [Archangiaceae bacterium]
MTTRSFWLSAALLVCSAPAFAETFTIYVAARDSDAHKAAEKLVDDKRTFWFAKMAKAIPKAVELINGTANEVRIHMAQGQEAGLFGMNGVDGSKGKLFILGGWCADWKTRDPFQCPTEIIAGDGRPDAFFNFGGNKTLFGELVLSGFIFDAAPSNKYDAKTNSLLKGTSRTIPLLSLKQVVVQHLVISDNVFLNGAQRAFEVYHSPMSNETVVDVQNNFFLNNVIPLKFSPAGYKGFKTKAINFKNNSVILNWPFNPDPTSSDVGALTLWHKDCCTELNIESNLFAYNPGGAMQHDWPEARMPKLRINNNLFYMNATLFGNDKPEAGFFAGKFGPNPSYIVVNVSPGLVDDYGYEMKGNVVMDPKVPVALVDLQAADSSSVTAKKTVMNDIRGMFGINKEGGTVAIKNYAPRMGLDLKNLPFPAEEKAKQYGVQTSLVYK